LLVAILAANLIHQLAGAAGGQGTHSMTTGLRSVTVRAPARLHLGFLDLSGSMGRRFGSVGLTLDRLGVALTAERAPSFSVCGPQAQRAEHFARRLLQRHRLPETCRIAIHAAIPEHVGLGSGTQLAIAVGVAVSHLFGLDLPVRDIAALYDRGQRSGIGVGAFEQGGFLVDGGKGAHDEPPRIVSRIEFPSDWRVLLVFDPTAQGLHGDEEVAAFRGLPEFPESASGHLCRLMLMQGLPALLEADLEEFSSAVGELQRVIGDYFSPAQGGRFASPRVAEALAWLERDGLAGVGQSSWGPTGFAVIGSESRALEVARAAQARWGSTGPLQFTVCSARNRGGELELAEATRAAAG
jgi:beta-ribofuranosylaminobenzene 5'-phosphate synthase